METTELTIELPVVLSNEPIPAALQIQQLNFAKFQMNFEYSKASGNDLQQVYLPISVMHLMEPI